MKIKIGQWERAFSCKEELKDIGGSAYVVLSRGQAIYLVQELERVLYGIYLSTSKK